MKKIMFMLCMFMLVGCSNVPDGLIIQSNTTKSCIVNCDSGFYWDGNGTCIYNGTYNFDDDNCTVQLTQIDEGVIKEYHE